MKEDIVKQALSALSWLNLEAYLKSTSLDDVALSDLLGHIRHCGTLILRRPDSARETKRNALLEALASFVDNKLGCAAAARVRGEAALIRQIESTYQGILKELELSAAAKVDPVSRVSALIDRLIQEYRLVVAANDRELKRRNFLTTFYLLRDPDGNPFNADGAVTAMVEITGMTLKMEAYRLGWFDDEDRLVLPALLESDETSAEAGIITGVLAGCWRRWERTEERRRHLGGDFVLQNGPPAADWPSGAAQVLEYRPNSNVEIWDEIANERLNDRFVQTFMEMLQMTNLSQLGQGIEGPLSLAPEQFVSTEEVHSVIALCEILAYDVGHDYDRPGGLRLVEWLRGYVTLHAIAESEAAKGRLIVDLTRNSLKATLQRVGLSADASETFLDRVTFRKASWDLFDHPLILLADGTFRLLAPAILPANPARVTLSAIANLGAQLARKGEAFEADVRSRLSQHPGLKVHHFTAHRDGEAFEYDCLVEWGSYLFLLECKNRSLSGHNPAQAYYFGLETSSHVAQVMRLRDALTKYPDILADNIGSRAVGLPIIPCVVNSLPFAVTGGIDGVYFIDASALKRFFEQRYLRILSYYGLPKGKRLLHRAAVMSFWKGSTPTPDDLIRQLEKPFQVDFMMHHTESKKKWFPVGKSTWVCTWEYSRSEPTDESVAKFTGANLPVLRKERRAIRRVVEEIHTKAERDSIVQQDRAWRKRARSMGGDELTGRKS